MVGTQLSIVIVNWNARRALLECLDSLQKNPPATSWEVVLVDNASSDGSADAAREAAPWVRLIANDRNAGLAAGNNQGMRASVGDVYLISNPDIIFQPNNIDDLRAALDRHPRAAFVVPRLVYPDGRQQPSAGNLPTLSQALIGRRLARLGRRARSDEGIWWDGWAHDEERQVGRGAEACYLVRRAAVEEIGLQDERCPLDWEGIDWSASAHEHGWETWFTPVEIVHAASVSVSQVRARVVVQSHRGMYRYFSKRRPAMYRPLLLAAISLRALAKLAITALSRSSSTSDPA